MAARFTQNKAGRTPISAGAASPPNLSPETCLHSGRRLRSDEEAGIIIRKSSKGSICRFILRVAILIHGQRGNVRTVANWKRALEKSTSFKIRTDRR